MQQEIQYFQLMNGKNNNNNNKAIGGVNEEITHLTKKMKENKLTRIVFSSFFSLFFKGSVKVFFMCSISVRSV